MLQRILAPLDGSSLAEQALRPAVSLARAREAELHLATVKVPPSMGLPELPYEASVGDVHAEYLESVASRARDAGVATVSTAVLTGADVVGVLEAHREEIGAGLTVLASHGRGPVARAWLGSVADRFVRTSSAPVLLVRAADEAPEPDLASDLPLTRVLVPVDGSRRSEAALEPATELAGPDGVEYTLLRVVESPHALGSLWFPHAVELTEEQVESVRDAAQGEADATARTLADRGYAVEPLVEFGAPVAAVVLDVAARRTPDLIAISTHGRGGVRRLLLGSVADKVVRGAECPVLVVRPRD